MDRSEDSATESPLYDDLLTKRPPRRRRRERTQFSPEGLQRLEAAFLVDKYPDVNVRDALAEELGVTEDRIQTWFQNRRSRQKRCTSKLPPAEPTRFAANQIQMPSSYGSPFGLRAAQSTQQIMTSYYPVWPPFLLPPQLPIQSLSPKPLVEVKPMIQTTPACDTDKKQNDSDGEKLVLKEEEVNIESNDSDSSEEPSSPQPEVPETASTPVNHFRPWEHSSPESTEAPRHFLYMTPPSVSVASSYLGQYLGMYPFLSPLSALTGRTVNF